MTTHIQMWSGVVLVALGLGALPLLSWFRSHELVQNGLALSGALSCVVNGVALIIAPL
jgi:hypothetical protein